MSIAEYSIKNKVISWLFIVILAIGGVTSFLELGRLEDPASVSYTHLTLPTSG